MASNEDWVVPAGEHERRYAIFPGHNPRNGLYDFAREQPSLRHVDEQVLASHLRQWGLTPWRSSQARGWEFPPLLQCRARWDEKYPEWKWQHPDLTAWQEDDRTNGFINPNAPIK
jgi:hypothetical protein